MFQPKSFPPGLTLETFLQLPNIEESPAWEFVGQIAIQKTMPTFYHSRIQKRLLAAIDGLNHNYEAFPELRCILSSSSVVPDVAIIQVDRIPTQNGALQGPPDWAVEILSPDQRSLKVIAKLELCLREGMELGWLIDPEERLVLVMGADRPIEICQDRMTIPSLPALNLELTTQNIFQDWLNLSNT
jgi:Uma2 family endonuclease